MGVFLKGFLGSIRVLGIMFVFEANEGFIT